MTVSTLGSSPGAAAYLSEHRYCTFSARRGECFTLACNQENQSMIGESDEPELGGSLTFNDREGDP